MLRCMLFYCVHSGVVSECDWWWSDAREEKKVVTAMDNTEAFLLPFLYIPLPDPYLMRVDTDRGGV